MKLKLYSLVKTHIRFTKLFQQNHPGNLGEVRACGSRLRPLTEEQASARWLVTGASLSCDVRYAYRFFIRSRYWKGFCKLRGLKCYERQWRSQRISISCSAPSGKLIVWLPQVEYLIKVYWPAKPGRESTKGPRL